MSHDGHLRVCIHVRLAINILWCRSIKFGIYRMVMIDFH